MTQIINFVTANKNPDSKEASSFKSISLCDSEYYDVTPEFYRKLLDYYNANNDGSGVLSPDPWIITLEEIDGLKGELIKRINEYNKFKASKPSK